MQVRPLGREDPLEEEMTTHSSILAWKIPRAEEPGGLQSTGWQRVGHDRADMHAMMERPCWCIRSSQERDANVSKKCSQVSLNSVSPGSL